MKGENLENILLCKNYNHAKVIIERSTEAKNVVVIGAGYIGVELAEPFEIQGKNVTLIDAEERIMSKYLDKEFTDIAEKEFKDRGIRLTLEKRYKNLKAKMVKYLEVVTDKGSI